uniref:Uncharacterized protein n=1 Tax=Setaria digitata TaxID=48799 RepID=A0A915PX34_9BILA
MKIWLTNSSNCPGHLQSCSLSEHLSYPAILLLNRMRLPFRHINHDNPVICGFLADARESGLDCPSGAEILSRG